MKNKISAVIAAYNEEKNIGRVLSVLNKSSYVDEIIVIDDSSKDNTEKVAKKYKKARVYKNKRNMGKAYCMEKGVKKSKSELIFFCDADIVGLSEKMIKKAVSKINGKDMFILGRDRIVYRLLVPLKLKINFLFLSGERIIKKELWKKIPLFYKHRFRIETGMNYYAKFEGKGYGIGVFKIRQIPKEKKYNFFKGFGLRLWMAWDIFTAVARANSIDRFKLRKFN